MSLTTVESTLPAEWLPWIAEGKKCLNPNAYCKAIREDLSPDSVLEQILGILTLERITATGDTTIGEIMQETAKFTRTNQFECNLERYVMPKWWRDRFVLLWRDMYTLTLRQLAERIVELSWYELSTGRIIR